MAKSNTPKDSNGFLRIRRGLFDHIKMGLMKGRDIPTYIATHFFADYDTGVAYNISAPFVANFLHEKPEKVRRALRRLEGGGYIKRFGQRGGDPGYDIVVDKYLVKKHISIDAQKSKSINEIAWTVTENCILVVNREQIDCISGAYRLSPIKEIKNISIKEVKKNGGKTLRAEKSFIPPTVEQVKEYAESIGYPDIDAAHFCEYYAANDWRRKDRKRMTNWKQAVVTWKKNKERSSNASNKNSRDFAKTSNIGETIEA